MTIPEQRRPSPEPPWCDLSSHADGGVEHRSKAVTVGRKESGGTVAAWLCRDADGHDRVGVNSCFMIGATAKIPMDEARGLRDALTLLLKRSGRPG